MPVSCKMERGIHGAECVETDVRNSNILPISVVRAAAAFEGRFGQMDIPMQLSVSTSIIARLMGVITKTDTAEEIVEEKNTFMIVFIK